MPLMKATVLDGFKRGLMNAWRTSLFNTISVTVSVLAQGSDSMPSNSSCREQWWESVSDAMNFRQAPGDSGGYGGQVGFGPWGSQRARQLAIEQW